ncbi:MAG: DUF1361 domain-containing protein [Myxococcota bacterium]
MKSGSGLNSSSRGGRAGPGISRPSAAPPGRALTIGPCRRGSSRSARPSAQSLHPAPPPPHPPRAPCPQEARRAHPRPHRRPGRHRPAPRPARRPPPLDRRPRRPVGQRLALAWIVALGLPWPATAPSSSSSPPPGSPSSPTPYLLPDLVHLGRHGHVRPGSTPPPSSAASAPSASASAPSQPPPGRRRHRQAPWAAPAGLAVLATVPALTGLALYLGRVLRFNSWDLATQPLDILDPVIAMVARPAQHLEAWGLAATFAAVFYAAAAFTPPRPRAAA